jgi:hypothetical protein
LIRRHVGSRVCFGILVLIAALALSVASTTVPSGRAAPTGQSDEAFDRSMVAVDNTPARLVSAEPRESARSSRTLTQPLVLVAALTAIVGALAATQRRTLVVADGRPGVVVWPTPHAGRAPPSSQLSLA